MECVELGEEGGEAGGDAAPSRAREERPAAKGRRRLGFSPTPLRSRQQEFSYCCLLLVDYNLFI